MEFCEADGIEWEEAGLHAMLAWLFYRFHSTRITGETAEQHVSSVNAAYATMGLQPPAKPAGSWRLYHDDRIALADFTKARQEGGGRDPKFHVPTTTEIIERLCYLTLKALNWKTCRWSGPRWRMYGNVLISPVRLRPHLSIGMGSSFFRQ
jgi:hypothetical protein